MTDTKTSPWLRIVPAMFLAGAAYYFGTGLDAVGALVWIAPLPVLVMASRLGAGQAAFLSLGAAPLGNLNMVSYLAGILPKPLLAVIFLIPALAYTGSVLLARCAVRRLPASLATLAFPLAWTSYEFLLSWVSPHGTAGSLAYTQSSRALIQVASITGIWGTTFLLTVADHHGRVLAEARSPETGDILLITEVAPGPAHTFYSLTGDWFAWLNLATMAAVIAACRSRRRTRIAA